MSERSAEKREVQIPLPMVENGAVIVAVRQVRVGGMRHGMRIRETPPVKIGAATPIGRSGPGMTGNLLRSAVAPVERGLTAVKILIPARGEEEVLVTVRIPARRRGRLPKRRLLLLALRWIVLESRQRRAAAPRPTCINQNRVRD